MPIFDTPITTDDRSLDKVMGQELPKLLIFHNNDIDKPLDDAIAKAAKKHAGDLLIVRLNVSNSGGAYTKYGEPPTPSLVALKDKRKVISDAERIRPADIRHHIAHLLDGKPLPAKKTSKGGKQALDAPIAVSDSSFRKEVLKSKVPVLVDFWAAWCGPCRTIAPHIEKLAKEYGGKLKVAKLDVDANPIMSRRYQVQSIPTMIVFEGGQPAARITGANPVALRKTVQRFVEGR